MVDYHEKYIKYKLKYLELKKQRGGSINLAQITSLKKKTNQPFLQMGNSQNKTPLSQIGFGALQIAFAGQETFEAIVGALVVYAIKTGTRIPFDTARVYGDCEKMLGAVLKAHSDWRQHLFIIVKVGIEFNEQTPYHLTRAELEIMIQESLEHIGIPQADCIMLHRLPRNHPNFAEALETLQAAKTKGQCASIGLSEISADTILNSNVDWIEIAYSPFVRTADLNGVNAAAKSKNIKILTYTSVLRGLLNAKILDFVEGGKLKCEFAALAPTAFQAKVFENLAINPFEHSVGYYAPDVLPKNIVIVAGFIQFCDEHRWDPTQVCLAYNVAKGFIPIPGTTKIANLDKNMAAAQLKLSADDILRIDAITADFRGDPNPASLAYLSAV